jgi:Predicted phosphohydrolases
VAVVGDLTMEGYRWEFEEARGYFDQLTCPNVVYSMGNHDAKNVGYRHFEEFFGIREQAVEIPVPEGVAKSSRSTRPSPTSTRARSGGSTTAGSTRSSGTGTGGRRYS